MTNDPDLHATIAKVMREDRGRLLAALISALGDFELAEDGLSDATESALIHWQRNGVPDHPVGWLLTVARRKAIDRIRRAKTATDREYELQHLYRMDEMDTNRAAHAIPDERLRLIFTCCHPALEPKTRVALTLRTIAGLSTREISRAFLDQETTMGQRLSRARAKIAQAGIPFAVPEPDIWDERLGSVLAVIYLIFNEGYGASSGDSPVRLGLCEEAVFLARLLNDLTPHQPEVEGLLALLLITHARGKARSDGQGGSIPLDSQDRGNWDHDMINEGRQILDLAMTRAAPGPYQIKAAISALHAVVDQATDWKQITLLYDSLMVHEPTPVVQLNRAVARAEDGNLKESLREFEALEAHLQDYQPFHAAYAEYLSRAGNRTLAIASYDKAIKLAGNAADIKFLSGKRAKLGH